ncbi:MAG TPA: 50S ribosomal protein L9 [Polyangiaceae bacterium]|jgi:large subunit ribosomal protein L9|nr:50S ribosomal protein L9 [Polyangiaceae bacterium]
MAIQIHVVLRQDLKNLGKSGSVVRVRPGYARNYLFPRSLAVPATGASLTQLEEMKRAAVARAAREKAEAEAVAAKLEKVAIKIPRSVGAEDKMYGSVTAKDIVAAYAAAGIAIDRRQLELAESIRTLGLHEVPLRLHPDLNTVLKVEVVKQS